MSGGDGHPRERADQLTAWATACYGPAAEVDNVFAMPGHAGLSYGFDVRFEGTVDQFVIRMAPPGVRRRGNTDVLRQVPLLQAMERCGVPVAPVVWSTADPVWFGTDVVVQQRLAAQPLDMFNPEAGVRRLGTSTQPYLRRAIHALALVHAVDWRVELSDWEAPRGTEEELEFWRRLLDKSPEPEWIELGDALCEALRRTDPGSHRIGVLHGDYQTNNVLYDADDGGVVAIVDWELSGVGPVALDVGWLAMMCDPRSWPDSLAERLQVSAAPEDVFSWYAAESGEVVPNPEWYTALASFRYGAISAFNVRLHRKGHRIDPFYEAMAGGVPILFRRGLAMLESTATSTRCET